MHTRRAIAPRTSLARSLLIRRHRLTYTRLPATTIRSAIPTMAGDSIPVQLWDFTAVSGPEEARWDEASVAKVDLGLALPRETRETEKPRSPWIRSIHNNGNATTSADLVEKPGRGIGVLNQPRARC